MNQRVKFTQLADGTRIAYAVAGSGPLLIVPPGWISHLELSWALPPERRFYETLASGRTLVRYDKPGCGLSDRVERVQSLEGEIEALAAVVRALGADRFELLGSSLGVAVSVAWAATRPESVARLVLYGGWLRGAEIAPPAVREHVVGLVRTHWGLGSEILGEIFIPEAGPAVRAAFARYEREAASPEVAARMLELSYVVDVTPAARSVRTPTLVLHREHDRAAPFAQGEALARAIPGARFVRLAGRTHVPYLGDADSVLKPIRRFLGLRAGRRPAQPSLTPRQRQVAEFVAAGLTNREIASRLGIDERSAEGHVERIRERLGFRSRIQIATWWVASAGGQASPDVGA